MDKTEKKNENLCACGCHNKAASTFLPGHDSKLHSLVMKISRGEAKTSELPKMKKTREYLVDAPWMNAKLRKAVGIQKAA